MIIMNVIGACVRARARVCEDADEVDMSHFEVTLTVLTRRGCS